MQLTVSAVRRNGFPHLHPESEKKNYPNNPVNPVINIFLRIESIPLKNIVEFRLSIQ